MQEVVSSGLHTAEAEYTSLNDLGVIPTARVDTTGNAAPVPEAKRPAGMGHNVEGGDEEDDEGKINNPPGKFAIRLPSMSPSASRSPPSSSSSSSSLRAGNRTDPRARREFALGTGTYVRTYLGM